MKMLQARIQSREAAIANLRRMIEDPSTPHIEILKAQIADHPRLVVECPGLNADEQQWLRQAPSRLEGMKLQLRYYCRQKAEQCQETIQRHKRELKQLRHQLRLAEQASGAEVAQSVRSTMVQVDNRKIEKGKHRHYVAKKPKLTEAEKARKKEEEKKAAAAVKAAKKAAKHGQQAAA